MNGHTRERGKRRDGSTKWEARYRNPSQPRKWISKTFHRKTHAERWLTQEQASMLRGDWADPRGADRTFADVADEYQTTWVDLEPRTKGGYAHILRKHTCRTSALATSARSVSDHGRHDPALGQRAREGPGAQHSTAHLRRLRAVLCRPSKPRWLTASPRCSSRQTAWSTTLSNCTPRAVVEGDPPK